MSLSIYNLRQAAQEILAAAVLEVFPGTQLLGGETSDIGFHYDFAFSPLILEKMSEKELIRIEDQMRLIVFEKRAITSMDMMRENAQDFFDHLGQPHRADQIGDLPFNVVKIFKMGSFHDACLSSFPTDSSCLTAFKLLGSECSENVIRISGTAFFDKESLKNYIKRFKEAKKTDPLHLSAQLELFIPDKEGRVYLPKGEILRRSLIEQWREMHTKMGFQFIHAKRGDARQLQAQVFQCLRPPLPFRLAQIVDEEVDQVSIFCNESNLLQELISSLQFIDQTIKIFGFERRLYLLSFLKEKKRKNFTSRATDVEHEDQKKKMSNSLLLAEAVKQSGIPLCTDETMDEGQREERIEFRLLDRYGQGWKGPYVSLDSEKPIVYRSLFGSIDRWVVFMVEQLKRKIGRAHV